MSGKKIIDGLKQAVSWRFATVAPMDTDDLDRAFLKAVAFGLKQGGETTGAILDALLARLDASEAEGRRMREGLEGYVALLTRAAAVPIPDDDGDFCIEKARRGAASWRIIAANTAAGLAALKEAGE